MSLTSHLKQADSPISRFLSEQFPDTRSFIRRQNKKLSGAETIRPDGNLPWTTLGTAIDYRLRYYFPTASYKDLVAWRGAELLSDDLRLWWEDTTEYDLPMPSDSEFQVSRAIDSDEIVFLRSWQGRTQKYVSSKFANLPRHVPIGSQTLSVDLIEGFFSGLDRFLIHVDPANKLLERSQEEQLVCYCFVLALFEDVARSGRTVDSPLLLGGPKTSVSELLSIARAQWVDDLCELSLLFYEKCKDHLSDTAILNPTFEGSRDVGGADAGIILDSCLIDVKATVNPRITGGWLHQLLGYVLLDYSDQYRLDGVGVYLARQGVLLKWPLQWLMNHLIGRPSPPLEELRGRFRAVAQSTGKRSDRSL